MNMYQAFNQNPVNFVDPMGLITILVHGTGANDGLWFREYSPFAEHSGIEDIWRVGSLKMKIEKTRKLKKYLKDFVDGVDDKYRFRWSGDNNYEARKDAGRQLARYIKFIKKFYPDETINLVGHSHGGNVIKEALHRLKFKVDSVVFLATPNQMTYYKYDDSATDHWRKTGEGHRFDESKSSRTLNIYNRTDGVQSYCASVVHGGGGGKATVTRVIKSSQNAKNLEVTAPVGWRDAHTIMHGIEIAPVVGNFIKYFMPPTEEIVLMMILIMVCRKLE